MKRFAKTFLSAVLALTASAVFSFGVFAESDEIVDEGHADAIGQISSDTEPALSVADEPEMEIIEIEDEDSASAASPYAYSTDSIPAMAVADEPSVFEIEEEEAAASEKPVATGDNSALCETALVLSAACVTAAVAVKLKRV